MTIPIQPFLQPVTTQPRAVVAKAESIPNDGPSRDPRFEVDSCSVKAAVLTSGSFDPLKRGAAQAPLLSGSTSPHSLVQDLLEKGIPVCAHTCANCRHIDHDIDGAFCALSQDVEQAGIPNPDAANHCGDFDPKR